MNPIPYYLSLWELAHRWHDAIPSAVDDSSVTREIRDTLLALIEAVLHEQLTVYHLGVGWVVEGEKKHSPSFDRFDPPREIVVEDFEEMFRSGTLDRRILTGYSVSLETIFDWCCWAGFDAPEFYVPEWVHISPKVDVVPAAKARPEAEDKARCQEIATKKWIENPQIRIAQMAQEREIQIEGNGALYKLPTLLAWLRDIAPDTVKGKPGRPPRENTSPK